MTRVGLWILTSAIFLYLALCATLFIFQRSLLYFPQPSALGDASNTLALRVADANLMLSIRPREGPNALIYFGGNAEDVSLSLTSFSLAFPEHAIYMLHYRGYGGSSGSPSEAALHQDALALFEKVRAAHSDITVVGRSLGSGVAIQLARQRPLTHLILVTPYASVQGLAAARFPYLPVAMLLRDKFASWRYAPAVHVPTVLIAAENDEVIPRASTDQLYASFRSGVASLITIPHTGHNTISDSQRYFEVMRALVKN